MNASYAEICRVGNLEADIQQVLLVRFFFLKLSHCCCKTSIIQIHQRKVKNSFREKKIQKKIPKQNLLSTEIA